MEGNGTGECSTYIITAMLQLMQKKAFDHISITELCRKAGVSRMSFYPMPMDFMTLGSFD